MTCYLFANLIMYIWYIEPNTFFFYKNVNPKSVFLRVGYIIWHVSFTYITLLPIILPHSYILNKGMGVVRLLIWLFLKLTESYQKEVLIYLFIFNYFLSNVKHSASLSIQGRYAHVHTNIVRSLNINKHKYTQNWIIHEEFTLLHKFVKILFNLFLTAQHSSSPNAIDQ